MKLCFDTSVAIDIIGNTEWFGLSFAAYDVANMRRFDSCLSVSSTTDIVYVLHRRGLLSQQDAHDSLVSVFELFDLLDNNATDCFSAYNSAMGDYEDALIAHTAKRHNVDLIITRDKRGFLKSPVPAMSPEEFLRTFKPDDMQYEMIDF